MRALTLSAPLLLFAACSSSQPAAYTVRARVDQVQGALWKLQHEAIPTFRDKDGKTVGMAAMTMGFAAPAEGTAKVGDLVEVTFEVRWGDKPPMRVTAVKTLPAGTKLQL